MTPNKEDYLKCIYELGQLDQKITNKLIAEKMAFLRNLDREHRANKAKK